MSFLENTDTLKNQNTTPLAHPDKFIRRHIGPNATETAAMLKTVGYDSINTLTDAAVPKAIRLEKALNLPAAQSEFDALRDLKATANQNQVFRSFIGQGYYGTITPPVIQRSVFENPGWYTQYTPYQAEISQGRLEALLNFQTMASELTGLDIANASMLDEATAAAEAMTMSHRLKDRRNVFFISAACHPQTIEVVSARAKALGIEAVVGNHETFEFSDKVFGALVQYPDTFGAIYNYEPFTEKAHAVGAMVTVATDLLALTLIVSFDASAKAKKKAAPVVSEMKSEETTESDESLSGKLVAGSSDDASAEYLATKTADAAVAPLATSEAMSISAAEVKKAETNKLPEDQIPVLSAAKTDKKSEGSPIFRIMMTLGVLAIALGAAAYGMKKMAARGGGKKSQNTRIKVLTSHHLGPKKNLMIVQVAGETILLGVTDNNITMLKTLSLLDDEIPEAGPQRFDHSMDDFVQDEEEPIAMRGLDQIRDTVSARLKNMRNI